MAESFLFYDLETFGIHPMFNRIAQFAAVRTDRDLNPVEEPLNWTVKPAGDLLPSPGACLVTGINPWTLAETGEPEFAVMSRIQAAMSVPGTCTLGYNSYRFDDAFVRNGFYRNFLPIYRREYEHGNSRWDLLNVLRAAWALRPDGMVWPRNEKDQVSFRLEDLATANGVREGSAHEAMSDVMALIGLARRLRQAQPKFWDYAFSLRQKTAVQALLSPAQPSVLLHVNGYYGFGRHLAAPLLPLGRHPTLSNDFFVFDLAEDPAVLLDWDHPDEKPPGLRTLRSNEGPMLFQWHHLKPDVRQRLMLDSDLVEARADWLRENGQRLNILKWSERLAPQRAAPSDVDAAIFEGFFSPTDERWMRDVRTGRPDILRNLQDAAGIDSRLPELLFRYRARNFPDTLDAAERQRWQAHCLARFDAGEVNVLGDYNWTLFSSELEALRDSRSDAAELALLAEVERFALHQRELALR